MIPRLVGEVPTFETRHEANLNVDKQKRYKQIIEVLQDQELTAKEIAVKMFEKGYIPTSERNFAAPRLTELSIKGVVEPIGKVRCEYTGKKVAVYKLIDEHFFKIKCFK